MRTQKTSMPSHQRLPHFSLRPRRKKEGVIQGKLRIRSIPGAFLVLGMVVVIVGTALAVAGYWPYRVQRSALGAISDSLPSTSQASGWGLGAKGLFSTASLIHSERMKLLGPVIMGVGLFILICANTVLFENRDRETQMLLAQMRSVICSVSAAVPSADLTQVNSLARHYQWVSSLPAAHLNILCLQELASSEPLLQVKITEEEGGLQQRASLCTEVLHHQESSSTPSIHSSNSCNSSKVDTTILDAEQGVSCGHQPQPEIHCKLSNYLASSSMSTLEGEDWELSILPPRRSHSMNYRTKPHTLPSALILEERAEKSTDNLRELRQQSSSNVCVNLTRVGTVTLDLAHMEEQKHRSWPRLDLGYTRRYLKLENKEDSVDKLLDQLEQQCSQLDQSFGSGPFQ
ncbi:transmembrane protein 200A [Pygocentrus nattereri]|uniref:Transmembrane protein 200B n=1 Tax=Pygocentrus nattereri TaxID=42514 RepID=A0A3B4EGS4_PYGNA|nr:transmembrane protein 200A [Pygocentrus nattereri]XP_037399569.1 transmembrane protein 200A [Pygocentrus nattereri]XP_037399638.1 transmembrane protein 200A [Pygocentrus nattereri]